MNANKQLQQYYEEIWTQVQSEITKSYQILWFLGVLLLFGLNKIWSWSYDIVYRVILFVFIVIDVLLLLYTNLGKWYLWLHKTWEELTQEKSETMLMENIKITYKIWKEKHRLNKITTLLTVVIFLLLLSLAFFK